MKKTFKVAQIRELLHQVHSDKITFSRYVEILNEIGDSGKVHDFYSREEIEKGFEELNKYYRNNPEDIQDFGHCSATDSDIEIYSKSQSNFLIHLIECEKHRQWRFPFNH
jgi:hypothetical protein